MSNSLLWLDDEPEILLSIAQFIEKQFNTKVTIKPTVEEFLDAASSRQHELVLIDIGVPMSAGFDYPDELTRHIGNGKYAGSAVFKYMNERKADFGDPRLYICSGHAPDFVTKILGTEVAYRYVNKSLILLSPHSFVSEIGLASSIPMSIGSSVETGLDSRRIHDVRARLLQLASVIASVTQSASRMIGISDAENPADIDFEKCIRAEFALVSQKLDEIDAYKHAKFIDDIEGLLSIAVQAEKNGIVASQTMVVEAVFEAAKACRRYNIPECALIGLSLDKILHLYNYATISQQINDIVYTANLLGVPRKDESHDTYRVVIQAESTSLQSAAASRNLDIKLDLKSDQMLQAEHLDRFRSAFYNVLANAVTYNGEIGSKRTWVDVRLFEKDQMVVVEVESWGDSLPIGERNDLIRNGYRGSNARRLGFGMGLSIVKQNMEDMGGALTISIREASNSTRPRDIFTVRLSSPIP